MLSLKILKCRITINLAQNPPKNLCFSELDLISVCGLMSSPVIFSLHTWIIQINDSYIMLNLNNLLSIYLFIFTLCCTSTVLKQCGIILTGNRKKAANIQRKAQTVLEEARRAIPEEYLKK